MNIMAIVLTWRQMNGLGTAFHLTADPHRPAPEVDLGLNKVSFHSTSRVLSFLFFFFFKPVLRLHG